jgi:hypothetical protein
MASKKTSKPASSKTKSKPEPKPQPGRLQNLAARPSFDELTMDEQLVDNSGVFRVTSALQQAQVGHDEDQSMRFPSDSLVMQAQAEGFRDDGVTLDDAITEHSVEDEATRAEKAARLRTLAARARTRQRR